MVAAHIMLKSASCMYLVMWVHYWHAYKGDTAQVLVCWVQSDAAWSKSLQCQGSTRCRCGVISQFTC